MHTYHEYREACLSGGLSCETLLASLLERAYQREELNCFITMNGEKAMEDARESDRRFTQGSARPLEGIVVAVKDNISTRGLRTTCASKILENFVPVYDATVVRRLKDAGAIIIGKTNLDEFAMGSSNETSYFGPVLHPLDHQRVPGGSSGGSAVSVAADLAHVSLGSDTGGSVRQPAAFCGVYGLKPTYGRVSRYGLVAFASSLDQIGIFSKDASMCAATFDVISGFDPADSTSMQNAAGVSLEALSEKIDAETVVGILPLEHFEGCDQQILDRYTHLIGKIRDRGFPVVTVEIPHQEAWIPTYYVIATAEASSNLSRFDGVRYGYRTPDTDSIEELIAQTRSEGFGAEVKRRIMLGTYVLSAGHYDAYYRKAQQARRLILDAYATAFADCDYLLLPTTPGVAFKLGEKSADPISMYLSDLFTVSANLAGIPAMSFDAGQSSEGLPIGLQVQGPSMDDEGVIAFSQFCHLICKE